MYRRRSTTSPEPTFSAFRHGMSDLGMRWHAQANTILVSRAQDDDVMEAFMSIGITRRHDRQAELVRVMDKAIELANGVAGYRRAFGTLPDGWFEEADDGGAVPGCNEYLFVFGKKLAERTRVGRALRKVTGSHTTFVDLFLAVVYGRERYLRHRKDRRLPLPHPRDQSALALTIDDFFYEADAFWSNDDLFIYMNELEYVEDGSP